LLSSFSELGLFLFVELVWLFFNFLAFSATYWSAALAIIFGRRWLKG
jgi:hypothetical protein